MINFKIDMCIFFENICLQYFPYQHARQNRYLWISCQESHFKYHFLVQGYDTAPKLEDLHDGNAFLTISRATLKNGALGHTY